MTNLAPIIGFVQVFFAIVIGLYFWNLLRSQQSSKVAVDKESRKEMEQLRRMREISLTEPLAEKTRPASFSEIIGQEEGLKSLRAALCGPNPQHVIVYGPPGVGKTAVARLVLEEAKRNSGSPFNSDAKFVELDATTARFDERGIADPLIGSVHDPIYQGAGPMGMAGIPQPKPGAVSKAHGGVLFIDEIGELHPTQMNKLLKVLEDRKVFLESAYYNPEDKNVPQHIHEIFQNGLPADFRLIGATTRTPEDIPPAIRSRCLEVFFRGLLPEEIGQVALNAAKRIEFVMEDSALEVIKKYATNGREAVNTVQIAAGIALCDHQENKHLRLQDVEWVVNASQMSPRPEKKIPPRPQVGYVNGLAVYGPSMGTIIEIEVASHHLGPGRGHVHVTGVVEEEEMGSARRVIRRKSMAKGSVENVLTVLRDHLDVDPNEYDIHVNFPGGTPIDGPSAGISIATAIYSSLTGIPVLNTVAMTGEISVRGFVRPVGGVVSKVDAARQAGARKVIIPRENWQQAFAKIPDVEVVAVDSLGDVFKHALQEESKSAHTGQAAVLSASPV
ncbi:ATP-dependent protease LonB [Dethiobacter alkaliphilus]|uniref:endopeptidase La n=1 Tax=Dethiobacter alkaliphilus AHT 1 TaxID=555088 RepID=C0GEZ0_DETAL|nr:ATP-dependent protease LonB [Dethiobacter alkaliphilus]EEG78172.1 Sigma 54 interacting domain protein [Dethiobacter alkaliphilus AHT 1]